MKLSDDDFYCEDGKFVLTERYLSRRGFCCGNGCRHCPFGHESVPESLKVHFVTPRPYFSLPLEKQ